MISILHIIKMSLIGYGVFYITNNIVYALLAAILIDGAISKFVWFLSGFWYPIFEFLYIGHVTMYGWIVLGISIMIVLISVLSPKLGYKWSIYFMQDGELRFALHENSPTRLLGYIITYYERGEYPVYPWEVHINFNPNHSSLKIEPKHFTKTGLSDYLKDMISEVDPEFMRKGAEPYFVDVLTGKEIPMKHSDLSSIIDGEVAYHDIMKSIFKIPEGDGGAI